VAKIMIIDDDTDLLENLAASLSAQGMSVTTRDTVDDAIGEIVAERPDVLVLDVMFPENPSGGFDLARKVRKTEQIARTPIVLLTAVNQEFPTDFSRNDIDEEWFPVQDLLEKPVDVKKLLERLTELLSG
jgi:DNA-binding response OmpR family regulator